MTMPQNWEDSYYDQVEGADQWAEQTPSAVKVEFEETQRVAPESASWNNYVIAQAPTLTGTGTSTGPTQIVTHKYHRYKAKFLWTIPAGITVYIDRVQDRLMANALSSTFQLGAGGVLPEYDAQQPLYAVYTGTAIQSGGNTGSVAPVVGAGATIVNTAPLTGTYQVTGTVFVTGGTAADNNNMQLVFGGTVINLPVVGATVTPVPFSFILNPGGNGLTIKSIGAGSAGATYNASIQFAPVPASSATVPSVSVFDESYKTVQ